MLGGGKLEVKFRLRCNTVQPGNCSRNTPHRCAWLPVAATAPCLMTLTVFHHTFIVTAAAAATAASETFAGPRPLLDAHAPCKT